MTTKNKQTVAEATPEVTVPTFPTVEDYRAADQKGKAAIRRDVEAAKNKAIDDLDLATAQAAKAALETYTAGTKAEKAPVDYQTVVTRRIAVLRAAALALAEGQIVPEGFPEEFEYAGLPEKVEWSDEEHAEIVAEAVKMASAKQTRSGKRNDVAAAITEAFDDVESGTFLKVSEIANKCGGSEWGGRITARLFPKDGECTVPGIVPVPRTATTPAGAKKA